MLHAFFQALCNVYFMALHVVNSGSFPRPLNAEQEHAYLLAWHREGDRAARDKLIEHNLRLVAHIIKKYYSSVRDQEDLISIGTIGLIKAVSTFDPDKGSRLATYASRCIENEILMHFRAGKKTAQEISMMEPIDTDKDGNPLTLMDVIAQDDTMLEELDLKINAEKLYRYMEQVLDGREIEILQLRFGLAGRAYTQREVGRKLNISRSYVSRIEKRALEKLKSRFEQGDVQATALRRP